MQFRSKGIGGKGSTEYVVKGSRKEVPQELIEELKLICKVLLVKLYQQDHLSWVNIFSSQFSSMTFSIPMLVKLYLFPRNTQFHCYVETN